MSVKKLLQELTNSSDGEINLTEKQMNIVCAAIEMFSEKGFAATSTSEIAKKAGVAEGTIFRHYNTKKDLLLAIPEYVSKLSISKEFISNIGKTLEDPKVTVEDFLRAIIQNRRTLVATNFLIIKVLLQELPFHPDLKAKITQSIFSPARQQIIKVIDYFKGQGQIIDLPSNTIANLIITSIFGNMFIRYIAQLDFDWDKEKETELLIQYIMNGIKPTKS
ncbi:TetR/AcrR family transcriptional regulator [Calidifontibacillus oryziterrae]|uniref:TetR/AcrR family transcriptional regulator n=1 Tax=Calidifontibacillus oryziterrae TaxID=1191699 RepID=UPI0002F76FE5|nr:TetR/AcrR family transcriptional regulator [Calidifontibacillus oryziterrae]